MEPEVDSSVITWLSDSKLEVSVVVQVVFRQSSDQTRSIKWCTPLNTILSVCPKCGSGPNRHTWTVFSYSIILHKAICIWDFLNDFFHCYLFQVRIWVTVFFPQTELFVIFVGCDMFSLLFIFLFYSWQTCRYFWNDLYFWRFFHCYLQTCIYLCLFLTDKNILFLDVCLKEARNNSGADESISLWLCWIRSWLLLLMRALITVKTVSVNMSNTPQTETSGGVTLVFNDCAQQQQCSD